MKQMFSTFIDMLDGKWNFLLSNCSLWILVTDVIFFENPKAKPLQVYGGQGSRNYL